MKNHNYNKSYTFAKRISIGYRKEKGLGSIRFIKKYISKHTKAPEDNHFLSRFYTELY